jgi:hypothetical protein
MGTVNGAAIGGTRRPLTLPEHVLLASDRRDAPVAVALLGRTDGHLDAGELAVAASAVFAGHRATRAELTDRAGSGGWLHLPDPRAAAVTEVAAATREDAWRELGDVIRQIDLRRAPLARLLVGHHADGDWIGIAAHHLAVDGSGLLTLLTETMAAYQQPTVPGAPAGTRDASPAPHPGAGVWLRARVLRRVTPRRRFLRPVGRPGQTGFAFVPEVIPAPRPARLADGRIPTVNDVLVAAGHLAAERWNARRGQASGTLRVRVPVRGVETDQVDGVSTGFAIISSDAVLRAEPPRLLALVVDRTTALKARPATPAPGRARLLLERLLHTAPARPRLALLRLAVAAVRPALMPTAAVGSLGHVPADLTVGADGPRLLDLHFTATVRMPQGLVLHATRMGGRLHLTFCHTHELFDGRSAREFVGLFLAAVSELAEPGVPAEAVAAARSAHGGSH